jgi:RNA polymerase sigma factor (sigma-70 family)
MKKETSNETINRLDILHRNHYNWLFSVGFKISKSSITTEDLIQELYVYLIERDDKELYYKDSFNLQYCRAFIMSRFYNLIKVENRWDVISDEYDKEEIPYNEEFDIKLDKAYKEVLDELNEMKKKKGWSSAMLAELYWFSEMTFDELSKEIGISKSTAFLNVRKVKQRLKEKLNNPFKNDRDD